MWPWMELGLGLRLVELLSELFLQCTQSLSPFLPSPIDMIVKNSVTSLSFSHFSLICLSFEGSTVYLLLSESRQGTSVLPNQAAGTPWSSISFAPGDLRGERTFRLFLRFHVRQLLFDKVPMSLSILVCSFQTLWPLLPLSGDTYI